MTVDKNILKLFNANPWGARVGDCVIRALVLGIGIDYKEACKTLGVSFKNGRGLIRDTGIDLYDVKDKFKDYFDVVQDYYEDIDFVPDEYADSKINDQMNAIERSIGA